MGIVVALVRVVVVRRSVRTRSSSSPAAAGEDGEAPVRGFDIAARRYPVPILKEINGWGDGGEGGER
jgi:hypothetical protein